MDAETASLFLLKVEILAGLPLVLQIQTRTNFIVKFCIFVGKN